MIDSIKDLASLLDAQEAEQTQREEQATIQDLAGLDLVVYRHKLETALTNTQYYKDQIWMNLRMNPAHYGELIHGEILKLIDALFLHTCKDQVNEIEKLQTKVRELEALANGETQ